MTEIVDGCGILSDALEAYAGYIVVQKGIAVAELIGMAATFVADQAAAVATVGIAEAAVPVIIAAGRKLAEFTNPIPRYTACPPTRTISMRSDDSTPSDDIYRCRVCGLLQDDPPWGEDGHTASFEICACCGTEFGYEDATQVGIDRKRASWLAAGTPWFDRKQKPAHWDLDDQLAHIPRQYPPDIALMARRRRVRRPATDDPQAIPPDARTRDSGDLRTHGCSLVTSKHLPCG